MPNHVNNAFTVEGKAKDVDKFIKLATQNGESEFKFQNLYPMPDELNITSGSSTDQAIAYYKTINEGDTESIDSYLDMKWMREYFPKDHDLSIRRSIVLGYFLADLNDKALAEGKQAIINKQKYGHKDWRSWSNKHWGTKWDCYEVVDVSRVETKDGSVEAYWNFDTAWDIPRGFVRFLTNTFPKLTFSIEGLCESGWKETLTLRNGKLISSEYLEADQIEEDYKQC